MKVLVTAAWYEMYTCATKCYCNLGQTSRGMPPCRGHSLSISVNIFSDSEPRESGFDG